MAVGYVHVSGFSIVPKRLEMCLFWRENGFLGFFERQGKLKSFPIDGICFVLLSLNVVEIMDREDWEW